MQEFGRAGWDGLPATACIVYCNDDIQHLCYWLCNGDKQRNSSIAIAFSKALKFSYAHLARECRHEVVLEGFGEQLQMHQDPDNCCDVCVLPKVSLNNRLHELTIMVNAIDEIGTKGEKKLAQYVRCGNEAWIKSLANLSASKAYGRSPPNLTLEWWHQFARQCSVAGYLDRKVDCGSYFSRSTSRCIFLLWKEKKKWRKKRFGRGSNPLSVAKELMKSQDNWQEIISKEQYQFPGVSINAQSSAVLYSKDISKLPEEKKFVQQKVAPTE